LGGAVTLAGISGKFGTLKNESCVHELMLYLYSRGAVREAFWDEFAKNKPPEDTAPAGKGSKAAPPSKVKGKDIQEAPTVAYPSLPDLTHPDPNHGPSRSFWANLLSQCADDSYSYASNAPPIAVCLLGLLQEPANMLVKCGVDVNIVDSFGISPLMYALLFSFRDLSISLLQQGADIDAIDQAGNPVVKYAVLSILDLTKIPSVHCFNIEDQVSNIFGRANVLDVILQHGVDLRVCDAEGNYPLHIAASFGSIDMRIGGYFISVRSEAYISSSSLSPILVFEQLCNAGAEVNTCSKNGLIPLHICSHYSDIESMQFLFTKGSTVNTADTYGFLPLHYCFTGGHSRALEGAIMLLELGVGRPIKYALFDDKRTGKSKDVKVSADIECSLEEIYSDALIPTSIEFRRTTEKDLLLLKTFEGTNLMQLTLSGHTLVYDNLSFVNVASDTSIRSQLVKFLLEKISPDAVDFFCNTDNFGTTLLHAMSLFFVGETPVEAVCPKRRVNPIVYGNLELHLLDYIYNTVLFDTNVSCSRLIQDYSAREVFPETWYPVMGSLFSKNYSLCQSFITRGADLKLFDAIGFSTKFIVNDSFSVGIKGLLAMREHYQIEDQDNM
jgi:ankyrin repeat protein